MNVLTQTMGQCLGKPKLPDRKNAYIAPEPKREKLCKGDKHEKIISSNGHKHEKSCDVDRIRHSHVIKSPTKSPLRTSNSSHNGVSAGGDNEYADNPRTPRPSVTSDTSSDGLKNHSSSSSSNKGQY